MYRQCKRQVLRTLSASIELSSSKILKAQEAELIDRLYEAFSHAPRPERDEITPHRCWECDEVRDRLAPHEVHSIPAPDMERLGDSMPLLSSKALRYYLPRYLEFSIIHPHSLAREFLLYHLADENPEEDYWVERYGIFRQAEREAIAEYFRYRTAGPDTQFMEDWLERGLNYWSKGAE